MGHPRGIQDYRRRVCDRARGRVCAGAHKTFESMSKQNCHSAPSPFGGAASALVGIWIVLQHTDAPAVDGAKRHPGLELLEARRRRMVLSSVSFLGPSQLSG